jgi:hypothetical protein
VEEFVMKRLSFLVACELGLMLSLAGCGGTSVSGNSGSTGGSSTDASQPGAAFTHRTLAGDATDLANPGTLSTSTLANGTGAQVSLALGLPVTTATSYTIKTETNGSVTLSNSGAPVANFNASMANLYSKDGIDFAVMSDTKPVTGGTQTDYVLIGKLNYTIFGYWAEVSNKSGTKALENGETFFFKSTNPPDANNANATYSGGNLAFTGIAAGFAKYDDKTAANADTVLPLMGTASLNITDQTTGTLVLDFSNFYKFTGSVNTGATGEITGSFTSQTANSGNVFPASLPAIGSPAINTNTINGQLFGTPNGSSINLTAPGEAAGVWTLKSSDTNNDIEISGAFGVKK